MSKLTLASQIPIGKDKTDKVAQNTRFRMLETVDKENVEPKMILPVRKTANEAAFRKRLCSDNTYDRPRKLQEINVRHELLQQQANDAGVFVKPRFSVYKEADEGRRLNAKKRANDGNNEKLNINKRYKKSSRKTSKDLSDCLPQELAYNINYMHEFIVHQIEIHEKKKLSSHVLKRNYALTAEQRSLIVKYLIKSSTHSKYPSFITYQAVKIFDFYVANVSHVELSELQIAALAALWIALKKDANSDNIPNASQLLNEFAGPASRGNKKLLTDYEKKVLMVLNFDVFFADPFSIYALLIATIEKVQELDSVDLQNLYYCGSYLIDVSLLHEEMLGISAVHLATVCAEITLFLYFAAGEEFNNPQWSYWRNLILMSNLTVQNNQLPDDSEAEIRNQLLIKVILSKDSRTDLHVVYKKYSTSRYGSISLLLTSKISTLYIKRMCNPNYAKEPFAFLNRYNHV